MKTSRFISAAAVCLALVGCSQSASVKGVIEGAAGKNVVVKMLDVNTYNTVDTLKLGSDGSFKTSVDVKKGQPEFVYLFVGDNKVASLLLSEGDKVSVKADTLGNYTVEGSEESVKLQEVEASYAAFMQKVYSLKTETTEELQKKISKIYVDYYRDRMKYIVSNSKSLTVVPVLFQNVGENFPVFSQESDAIIFGGIADSLSTVYPDSKYVKALKEEAKKRSDRLEVSLSLRAAEEVGFPDFELPDENGKMVRLGSIDKKVILLHFWTATDNVSKMFNKDVLAPVYRDYKDKGLEIVAVSYDTDKVLWGTTVKNQKSGWINLCDGLGLSSKVFGLYPTDKLPVSFFIVDGELVDSSSVKDEASLRRFLDSKL
ncbi:MAG: redoxin domain-containing protein [Bacteroidales bacterium]|nr:redoxin domain-containing protein [Bacteroidales bacterium]